MNSNATLLSGRRIMLLDDERYTLRMLRTVLIGLGAAEVIETSSAEEAVSALGIGRNVDCLFADFNLPKVHGLLLVKAIRIGARGLPRDLPIVMLTGHTNAPIVEAAKSLDVNGLIRKPVSRAQLETTLERVLSSEFRAAPPEIYRGVNVSLTLSAPDQDSAARKMADEMQVDLEARGTPAPPATNGVTGGMIRPLVERPVPAAQVSVGNIVSRASEIIEGVTFSSGLNINNRHVALIQHLLTTGPVGDVHLRLRDGVPDIV